MGFKKLVDASAASTLVGDDVAVTWQGVPVTVLVAYELSSTGSMKVQGRLDSAGTWVDLATVTTSGAQYVARYPLMRGNISANAGAISLRVAD